MDSSSNTPREADENNIETAPQPQPEVSDSGEPQNEHDAADAQIAANFKDGDILRFVRVRFPGNNRSFAFTIGDREYPMGTQVVAMSDRGMAVGFVNSFPYEMKFHKGLLPVRSIVKLASAEDMRVDKDAFRQERRLRDIAERLIEKNQLDMTLTQVELSQLGKKAIFSFTAPTRVDFRGLVHEMVGEMKMRIELRQISVRDRAAAVGGLGPCGRELCCSSFLAKYGNVGIKLAKNQDLSLNSSKINGVCGQLKCCLTFEDEVYQEKRKKMPRDNALVKTKDGNKGKVIRLHILSEQFETISPEGIIRRYVAEMWDGLAEGLEIPKFFENGITDNSKTVIGLDQVLAQKAEEHERDIKEAKEKARGFADDIFESLFGAKTLDWSLPEVAELGNPQAKKIVIPEEEEEIVYVAPEDEILDEDEDDEELEEGDDGEGEDDEAEELSTAPVTPAPRPQPQPQHARPQQPQGPRPQQPRGERPPQQQNNQPRRDDRPRQEGQGQPGQGGGRNRNRNRNRNRHRGGGGGGQGGGNPQGGQRPPQS